MAVLQRMWQVLVQRLRAATGRTVDSAHAGPAATGQDPERLDGLVAGLRTELEHTRSAQGRERLAFQEQLAELRTALDRKIVTVGLDQQGLRKELADLQAGLEDGLTGLHRDQQGLVEQLTGLQDELARTTRRIEQLHGVQQQQLEQVRSAHDATKQELVSLRDVLAESTSRQATLEERVGTLESRLLAQERNHHAAMQQMIERENRLARRLNIALTVAIVAVLLVFVVGTANYREVRHTNRLLAEMSQRIRDLQLSFEDRSSTHPALSAHATASVPPVSETREPAAVHPPAPSLPPPAFVVEKSLPLGTHTFRTRDDAKTFFEDNARQPGVISLPGGVQYRELIPGTGRTPAANDRVVVEYRTFRPDGTETDNSFRQEGPRTLSISDTPPGLREALLHMQEGAQWELYIPANKAYRGTRKRGPFAFEPVIVTLELISISVPGGGS